MVGLIFYFIGIILAFGLLYSMYPCAESKEAGMIIIGAFLSWITVALILYKVYDEQRKDSIP